MLIFEILLKYLNIQIKYIPSSGASKSEDLYHIYF